MNAVLLEPWIVTAAHPGSDGRIGPHVAIEDISDRINVFQKSAGFVQLNHRMFGKRFAFFVDPERWVKDLMGEMCVECCCDIGDEGKIPVNKLCGSATAVNGARSASSRDVERSLGETKIFLHINQQEMYRSLIDAYRFDAVLFAPFCGRFEELALIGTVRP